jgi:hypothetical protein
MLREEHGCPEACSENAPSVLGHAPDALSVLEHAPEMLPSVLGHAREDALRMFRDIPPCMLEHAPGDVLESQVH